MGQAQDDIDAAAKAHKKALEDEQKLAEEEQKASKGAAARAAFEAMNKGNVLPSENDEDALANALNPSLGKQKQAQIKLLRTKSKELLQAARMKKLQKAYKAALKKADAKKQTAKEVEKLKRDTEDAAKEVAQLKREGEQTAKEVSRLRGEGKVEQALALEKQADAKMQDAKVKE